jgi:hypothetical protein
VGDVATFRDPGDGLVDDAFLRKTIDIPDQQDARA